MMKQVVYVCVYIELYSPSSFCSTFYSGHNKGEKNNKKASRSHFMHNNLKCKFTSYSVECVLQDICMQESSKYGNNIK